MPSKYLLLLNRLVEKTQAGELDWRETAADNAFVVSFPNYSVVLSEEERPDAEPDYIIELINADGKIIDKFSDVMLEDTDPSGRVAGHFKTMRALFGEARRKALGVDQALDEILRNLNS